MGLGWQQANARSAKGVQKLITDAPAERSFLTQTNLGTDNADVIVRLDDGRLLAIECKGSNSEINSRKRLNKEAVQNARAWLTGFGADQGGAGCRAPGCVQGPLCGRSAGHAHGGVLGAPT